MKSRVFIALGVALMIMSACGGRKNEAREDNVAHVSLEGQKLGIDSGISLFELVYADDSLIIASSLLRGNCFVAFHLDGNDVRDEEEFLRIGRGPGEVDSAKGKVNGDTLHVLSFTGYGLTGSIRMALSDISDSKLWKFRSYPEDLHFHMGTAFDIFHEDEYVTLGMKFDDTKALWRLRQDLSGLAPVDFLPDDGYKDAPTPKALVYMNGQVFSNGDKLLYVCRFSDYYVTFLDMSQDPVTETPIHEHYPGYMDLDGIRPGRTGSGLSPFVWANDNHIYIEKSDTKLTESDYEPSDFKGYDPWCTDVVEVYDWDGNHVLTLDLDVPYYNLYVSDDDTSLFTLTTNPETGDQEIRKYDLKAACQARH